jgi:hypothetical protein
MDESASCPLCGEEKASAQSVEQHISASTDADHEGEHGPDHRDAIEGERTVGEVGGSPPRNGGVPSEDTATSGSGEQEPEEEPAPSPSEAGVEDGGGALLTVLVVVAAAVALAKGGASSGSAYP